MFSAPQAEGALRVLLVVVGGVAALITAVGGGIVAARAGRAGAAPRDRHYLLIVVAEFVAAGLGAGLLAVAGWTEFVPGWWPAPEPGWPCSSTRSWLWPVEPGARCRGPDERAVEFHDRQVTGSVSPRHRGRSGVVALEPSR